MPSLGGMGGQVNGQVQPGVRLSRIAIWLAAIFVCVLFSAYVAQQIGIAAIFGAFIMGLIMPRHAGLTDDVNRRLEDFVVTVLLPHAMFPVNPIRVLA